MGVEWLSHCFDNRIVFLYVGEGLSSLAKALLVNVTPARVKERGEEGKADSRLGLIELARAVHGNTPSGLVTRGTFQTGSGRTVLSGEEKERSVSIGSLSLVSSWSTFAHGPNSSADPGLVVSTPVQLLGGQIPQRTAGTWAESGAGRDRMCCGGPAGSHHPFHVSRLEGLGERRLAERIPVLWEVVFCVTVVQ